MLVATVVFCVGCLVAATTTTSTSIQKKVVWVSSVVNMGVFTMGSLYFVEGSYPYAQQFYMRDRLGEGHTSERGGEDELLIHGTYGSV
jgi:hypothetical protein